MRSYLVLVSSDWRWPKSTDQYLFKALACTLRLHPGMICARPFWPQCLVYPSKRSSSRSGKGSSPRKRSVSLPSSPEGGQKRSRSRSSSGGRKRRRSRSRSSERFGFKVEYHSGTHYSRFSTSLTTLSCWFSSSDLDLIPYKYAVLNVDDCRCWRVSPSHHVMCFQAQQPVLRIVPFWLQF